MDQTDYEMFKIVVIGSSGIGKSNIALRFVKGQFKQGAKSTIGVQFMHKVLTVNETKVKVTLWDTAGQEVYRALSKVYYKGALGVILVYDVTSQQSYLDVEDWYKLAKDNLGDNVTMIVLGNKIDLMDDKTVPFERALQDYKQKLGIECFEVSALNGQGIHESIMYLIEQIYTKNVEPQIADIPFEPEQQPNMKKSEIKNTVIKQTAIRGTVRPVIQVVSQEQGNDPMQRSKIVIQGGNNPKDKQNQKNKKKKCSC